MKKTVSEIARELDASERTLYDMMAKARKRYGVEIEFKRLPPGRVVKRCKREDGTELTEQQAEYLALLESGHTLTQMAATYGVGISTVSKTLRRARGEE